MMNTRRTLPDGFGHKEYPKAALTLALREGLSNAVNYGAQNAHAVFVKIDGELYLFFGHDGRPFESLRDILELGLTPNVTSAEGNAFAGVGLILIGSQLDDSQDARMFIASRTVQEGSWMVGRGRADSTQGNFWEVDDVTPEWRSKIFRIFGAEEKRFNVFYIWRLSGTVAVGRLGMNILNDLMFAAPDLVEKTHLTISGGVVGEPNNRGLTYTTFPELLASTNRGGEQNRSAISHQEYLSRYAVPEKPFIISTGPIDLLIDPSTRLCVRARFNVLFNLFPGDCPDNEWWKSQRSGKTSRGNTFDEGSASAPGKAPKHSCFLRVSAVGEDKDQTPDLRRAVGRFKTNSVHFGNADQILRSLGLPCSTNSGKEKRNRKPAVVIEIDMVQIERYSECEIERPFSPVFLLRKFGRRGDFTFSRDRFAKRVIDAVTESLQDKIPDELRQRLKEMYPPSPLDYVRLPTGGETQSNFQQEPENHFPIYDLRTGERYNKECSLGDQPLLCIYDPEAKITLPSSVLTVHARATRGVNDIMPVPGDVISSVPSWNTNRSRIAQKLGIDPESVCVITFVVPDSVSRRIPMEQED